MFQKCIFFITVCLISITIFSQEKTDVKFSRFAIRANAGIPKIISSEAFHNSFSGVVTADVNVTYKVFSNVFVGAGYAYTYFKSQKHFTDQRINTNMQAHNGYLKVGMDKKAGDKSFVTLSVNAGYNFNQYQSVVYKHDSLKGKYPTQFSSSFIEPIIGFYLITDPNFAIGAHISYNYNFSQFNPKYAGFDKWLSYDKLSANWNISMITLGFGFYFGLEKK